MLTLILRIAFNMKKMNHINSIEMDVFIKGDVIFSIVSVLVFYVISVYPPTAFLKGNESQKDICDLLVCLVLILAFSKYFLLFLIQEEISKMLLTLIFMLIDVKNFTFVLLIYLLASA